MKKVFIPSYGGGHANIMKLLYSLLKKSFDVEILALTLADDIYNNAGIPHNTIKDYLHIFSEAEQEKITEYGKRLAEVEYNPNSAMQYDDCIVYLGMGMMDLVSSLDSLELAEKEFHDKGRKAFCPVQAAKTILQHIKPDIVVLSVNVRFEAAAGIAANELGIPVLYINDLPTFNQLPFYSDICVMNEYTQQLYEKSSMKTLKNIYITGQPVFDKLFDINTVEISALIKQLKLEQFKKIIVYLEQTDCQDTPFIEDMLFQKSVKLKDVAFIMKLHPNMDASTEIDYITPNFIKARKIPLHPLLKAADVAITRNSTSGLEAAILGIPLILIEWPSEWAGMVWSEFDIGIRITSMTDFNKFFEQIIKDPMISCLKEKQHQFYNQKNASGNVLSVIEHIINNKPLERL